MAKIDLKKELKEFYSPSPKGMAIVDVPKLNFLMIDGKGDPNTALEYREAIEALYSVSYTLKFMIKKAKEIDYGVMPLEGLWWADDMNAFIAGNKDLWKWTSMIMQPGYVTEDLFHAAIEQVESKKKLVALSKLKLETFHEGLSAQVLHLGPYSEEGPTIARLHSFVQERGFELRGKHHEIYLSDPRKSAPEKIKTVVRQPIKKV